MVYDLVLQLLFCFPPYFVLYLIFSLGSTLSYFSSAVVGVIIILSLCHRLGIII